MPFKDGIFKHKRGFYVLVKNGIPFLSNNCPLSLRMGDMFNPELWEEVDENKYFSNIRGGINSGN